MSTPLKAPSILKPDQGAVDLRCGRCGGMEFGVHVIPRSNITAKVHQVACAGCGKAWRIDDQSGLQAVGTISYNDFQRQLTKKGVNVG